jgi:hypothetical protein
LLEDPQGWGKSEKGLRSIGVPEAPLAPGGLEPVLGHVCDLRGWLPALHGHPHLPDVIKDAPELWLRHKAHGSIRVQEGKGSQI